MWEKITFGDTPGWSWAYSFGISLNRRPYKTTVGLYIQTSHSVGIICPKSLYMISVYYSIFKPPACELIQKGSTGPRKSLKNWGCGHPPFPMGLVCQAGHKKALDVKRPWFRGTPSLYLTPWMVKTQYGINHRFQLVQDFFHPSYHSRDWYL